MTALIIDGKKLASEYNAQTALRVEKFTNFHGVIPRLCLFQVGTLEDSSRYLNSKKKLAEKLGMEADIHCLPGDIQSVELKKIVSENSKNAHGILIQFPLPSHLDQDETINWIDPEKEIDGIHPQHIKDLSGVAHEGEILPCTPAGIIVLVKYALRGLGRSENLAGLNVVVCGRSKLVGMPTNLLFQREKALVTVCHSQTSDEDRLAHLANADIVVVAVGKLSFLKAADVKPQAIVIDVGINYDFSGKIFGDVEYSSVSQKVSAITPVPGGVGPMTLAMLMRNAIVASENQMKKIKIK